MALNMLDLLGAMMQGSASSTSNSRMTTAGNGLQDLLGSLMSGSQSALNRAGQAVGGNDNLAAAGVGALLGALTGKKSTTMNSLGGGLMGLLGMMAYKALAGTGTGSNANAALSKANVPVRSEQQLASDAEIILDAMIDAARADGQVDADELNRITGRMKESGVGQDGMNYILSRLQGPMNTEKIVSAVRGRPDLAAQVYSASLMAIEVDTAAEKNYLAGLAKAMGLSSAVVQNIEQLVGMGASNPKYTV